MPSRACSCRMHMLRVSEHTCMPPGGSALDACSPCWGSATCSKRGPAQSAGSQGPLEWRHCSRAVQGRPSSLYHFPYYLPATSLSCMHLQAA